MRQAGSKEYAHELVELLPAGMEPAAIEMLEAMVGTRGLALSEVSPDESSLGGFLGEGEEILGRGELVSHTALLADHGGPAED
jgi:hypothetical protein